MENMGKMELCKDYLNGIRFPIVGVGEYLPLFVWTKEYSKN
jgi:hypothetical protein